MGKYPIERSCSRKNIRKPVSFELSLMGSGLPENIMKSGVGVDLGHGGIGLSTDYPLHEGDVLNLFFPVGVGNASLPVFSEVMWARPADGEFRAGLRFLTEMVRSAIP